MMVESALQFAPHSYRLWLVAVAQQQRWQDAAAMLQRGILALCKPLAAAAGGSSKSGSSGGALPEAQAAVALDLGLRLLQLLSGAGDADSQAALLVWAGADAGSSGGQPLAHRSKAVLVQALLPHPHLRCTLAICCAYAAAFDCLPSASAHCLGYQPAPLVALLRAWPPVPAARDASAWAACRAALVAGAGSLGLLASSPTQQPQQELEPQLLAAQCALLVAAMRLGGSALLAELLGVPQPWAALTVAQQRWQACSAQSPAELLILVQESVAAAAAAAASSNSANILVEAALQGRLHPAAALSLAACVASCRQPQAADVAHKLLGSWAIAYEAGVSEPA